MHLSIKTLVLLALSVISVAGWPVAFTGKRGIVYDWLSSDYSKFFVGSSKVRFGSDYHATRGETGATLDQSFGFISTLIVDGNLQNPKWLDTVRPLIDSGAVKTVFAYVAMPFLSLSSQEKLQIILTPSYPLTDPMNQTTPAKPT